MLSHPMPNCYINRITYPTTYDCKNSMYRLEMNAKNFIRISIRTWFISVRCQRVLNLRSDRRHVYNGLGSQALRLLPVGDVHRSYLLALYHVNVGKCYKWRSYVKGLCNHLEYQVWRRRGRRRQEPHCGRRVVGDGREEPLPLRQLQSGGHLLLPLGPPVLEPRLDLHLRQVQSLGELKALWHGEVLVGLKVKWVGRNLCYMIWNLFVSSNFGVGTIPFSDDWLSGLIGPAPNGMIFSSW